MNQVKTDDAFRRGAQQRLGDLRTELAAGQEQLQQLEARAETLRNTLLRISGAIQVLEELEAQHPRPN